MTVFVYATGKLKMHYKYRLMNPPHILNFIYTPRDVYKNRHIKPEKDILFLTDI